MSKDHHINGAEHLMRTYPRNTMLSLMVSSTLILGAFMYPTIKDWFTKEPEKDQLKVKSRVINYSQLSAPPPIELERPQPKMLQAVPKVKQVKFLQPVAKQDEEVPDEEELPTMEELETANISTVDQDGVDSILVDVDFVIEAPPEPEPREVFSIVQKMPEFEGGEAMLWKYLGEQLEYPEMAREAYIEGVVYIQFVIEVDGSISEVQVVRGVSYLLDNEAVRVISNMPNWQPGEQNGRKVPVKFFMPIRFRLNDQ